MKLNSVLLNGVIVFRKEGNAPCQEACNSENSREDDI